MVVLEYNMHIRIYIALFAGRAEADLITSEHIGNPDLVLPTKRNLGSLEKTADFRAGGWDREIR